MDQSQENPFSHIVQQFVAQHVAPHAQGAGDPSGAPQDPSQGAPQQSALADAQAAAAQSPQAPSAGGMVPDVQDSDLQPGTIQGTTPSIVQAINAINNVIKTSQDKDTIMVMRSIVSLLSRFVAQDQEAQAGALQGPEETPEGEQAQPQGQPEAPQGGGY